MTEGRCWNLTNSEREGQYVETIERLANEKEELIAEVRRLRELLLKYGRHRWQCRFLTGPCSCGLAAILTDEKSAGEKER